MMAAYALRPQLHVYWALPLNVKEHKRKKRKEPRKIPTGSCVHGYCSTVPLYRNNGGEGLRPSPPNPPPWVYNLGPNPVHIGTHRNDGPCLRRRVGNGLGPRENIKLAACPGKFSAFFRCLASVLFVYHWQKFSGNFLCVYLLFLKSKL